MKNTVLGATCASSSSGFNPGRLQALVDALQGEVDRQRLPGAVVLIAQGGKTVLSQALGLQQPANGTLMATNALFRIYSMTKPVTSVAAMMLVEQGKLLLNDPVAKWLPEFANAQVALDTPTGQVLQPATRHATVQDLMRHTAGLTYEFLGNGPVQRQYVQARIRTDLRERTNAEFSAKLATLPLIAEPASVWEYSRATDVLGRLIEVVSGQTLGAFFQSQVFDPLNMADTSFHLKPHQFDRIAEPFAKDPEGAPQMRVFDPRLAAAFESGGGGLVSSAADYARFLQCLLNGGTLDGERLLGRSTVDFMTSDHLGSIPVNPGGAAALLLPGYGFGLGFAVRKSKGLAPLPGSVGTYYWGGLAGTTFFVDPAEDLFAILMIQAPNQREYYRHLFRTMVYAALD
jgi:CubicO group peptidase (beta-lactamase class C family)